MSSRRRSRSGKERHRASSTDAATFSDVYRRLLQMLHLTELKKRYWLQSPEVSLADIGEMSLKVIDTMLSLALFALFHHSLSDHPVSLSPHSSSSCCFR
eukprot:905631-Rhodomonas_salina.2